MIACSHPGRCGDAIFCLPTIKALCARHQCQADFYTSDWCAPIEPLMRYQPFIHDFIIPPDYRIEGHGIGIQPWNMPIDRTKYEAVYQLGFKEYPKIPLPDHIAASADFEPLPLELEYPMGRALDGNYLVACSKSVNECAQAFPESPMFFQDMSALMRLVIVGMQPLRLELDLVHHQMNLLEVASAMHYSKGVLCSPSTPHTIAAFIPGVKMVTLKHHWLDERQMWKGSKQLVFNSPRADIKQAREFLGI
jgi:hypothetical protein